MQDETERMHYPHAADIAAVAIKAAEQSEEHDRRQEAQVVNRRHGRIE